VNIPAKTSTRLSSSWRRPGCRTLGTFILWLGWFGFNGGSELRVSDVAEANAVALIFLNTNTAAAGGVVAALFLSRTLFGKADTSRFRYGQSHTPHAADTRAHEKLSPALPHSSSSLLLGL